MARKVAPDLRARYCDGTRGEAEESRGILLKREQGEANEKSQLKKWNFRVSQ